MATVHPGALRDRSAGGASRAAGWLNEWAFYLPYLVSVVAYFMFIESSARVLAPAMVPVVVVAAAVLRMLTRRPITTNPRVVVVLAVWGTVSILSLLWGEADGYYSVRKVALPMMCMVPGIFRFRVTRIGALAFAVLLLIVGVLYTTQTADTFSEGFTSTDSPYESILGVAFGIYTVWLVGVAAPLPAAVAYAACVLFFKRNAILVAPVVAMIGLYVSQLSVGLRLRLMRAGIAVVLFASPIVAVYLSDIYQWLAASSGVFTNAENLSSGRSVLYLIILNQIDHAGLAALLFGHGAGAVEQLVSTTGLIAINLGLAHNEYLSLIFDFGIVGFVLIAIALLRCVADMRSAMVMLFLAVAMSGENFFLITFSCLVIFFLLSADLEPRPATPSR